MKTLPDSAHSDTSMYDLADLWLSALCAQGRSPATIEAYRYCLDKLRDWRVADPNLETLSRLEARAYLRHLQDHHTPGGVAFQTRHIRALYGWLVNEGEITSNPFKGLVISVQAAPQTTATESEISAMLGRAKGKPRDLALLTIMVDSGCRKGEIAALRREDIDMANRLITFTKSKTTPRIVPMSERTAVAVTRWLRRRGVGPGGLWNVGSPYALVERILPYYSHGKLSPHSLRRAFAVAWLAKGGTESGLMRVCGWSDATMVRTYIAARGEALAHDEYRRLMG